MVGRDLECMPFFCLGGVEEWALPEMPARREGWLATTSLSELVGCHPAFESQVLFVKRMIVIWVKLPLAVTTGSVPAGAELSPGNLTAARETGW